MGGNALASQGVTTRRITASEYHDHLVPSIMKRLRAIAPSVEAAVIPSYEDKPDFGDVDILVNSDTLPARFVERVLGDFQPKAHVNNGPVLSFDHDGFQVDLIRYGQPIYGFAARYFAYNDLGNLIGRVARSMGFIFGHAGLLYPLRDPENHSQMIDKILVTRNFALALRFLGYDPRVYEGGFEDLESIYRFAASSLFYDPAVFALEARDHRSRTRDIKRPTYRAFLAWAAKHASQPTAGNVPTRDGHLRRARQAFPRFAVRYDDALSEHARNRRFREIYNGRLVGKITGLQGRALGQAMASIVSAAGGKAVLRSRVLQAIETMDDAAARRRIDEMVRELISHPGDSEALPGNPGTL